MSMKTAITLSRLTTHSAAANDMANMLARRLARLLAEEDFDITTYRELLALREYADTLVATTKASKDLLEDL